MEQRKLEAYKERLGLLREQGEALRQEAGDFPALERNCARLLASLKMMEIDLGLLTVPEV
ncbi:MAG: hypothetical protein KQJ78_14470 [Deltaproteobacteria bacterium]|nr:hypothetical protein [Deltaproteobacteria bacterium]